VVNDFSRLPAANEQRRQPTTAMNTKLSSFSPSTSYFVHSLFFFIYFFHRCHWKKNLDTKLCNLVQKLEEKHKN